MWVARLLGEKWEVGHYAPNGDFEVLVSYKTRASAVMAIHYLNGGSGNLPSVFS